ncbi:MAG: arginine--tRNA ligase [bacterium]
MLFAPIPEAIRASLARALREMDESTDPDAILVERPKNPEHGHYASNIALLEAKRLRKNPREIANALAERLASSRGVRADVAPPGFLNFTIAPEQYHAALAEIVADARAFLRAGGPGRADGRASRVLLEFVSANPTGPLNVVSARAAAVGDTIGRVLEAAGFDVAREFYVNDHGNQADLLGESVRLFLVAQEAGQDRPDALPAEGYAGEYVGQIAREARPRIRAFTRDDEAGADDALLRTMRGDGPGLFERAERLAAERAAPLALSARGFAYLLREFALDRMLATQEADLRAFGVIYDRWFRESELHAREATHGALDRLRAAGHVFERDGATWFRSTTFGDDQDRVLIKSDGAPTYFLADIAYHDDKRTRGYDFAIDLLGPDHHGHIPRLTGATRALGAGEHWLDVLIVQQVNLLRAGEVVKMSKRRGEFVTLHDLMSDIGIDVARWFFLMRRCESHLDFDLDLAKKESDENPVYYVQYAHARIHGLFARAREAGFELPDAPPTAALLAPLIEPEAIEVMRVLQESRAAVYGAALGREPHRLTSYLTELATAFHVFYHHHQIVVPGDAATTTARLALCRGTQRVIREVLALLGISAPERM